MKVRDLIQLLEGYDPEARVIILSQPQWPFECDLAGVVARGEVLDQGEGPSAEAQADDVFLLEGRQLRYGSKAAWQKVQR